MAEETTLPKGIRIFPKHPNAAEFVLGTIVISLNEFIAFCRENPELLTEYNGEKQIKLQRLRSQSGNEYLKVDTFKPSQQPLQPAATTMDDVDKLPF